MNGRDRTAPGESSEARPTAYQPVGYGGSGLDAIAGR
jgi:hypothetical protein